MTEAKEHQDPTARLIDECENNPLGPSPELVDEVTSVGPSALRRVAGWRSPSSMRNHPHTTIDFLSEVLSAFARRNPRWVVSEIDATSDDGLFSLAEALAGVRDPSLAPVFLGWLESPKGWLRDASVKGLIRLRFDAAIDPLVKYLNYHPKDSGTDDLVKALFEWPALRRAVPATALRRVADLAEAAGVKAWAIELAECAETGRVPKPRPDWFGTV